MKLLIYTTNFWPEIIGSGKYTGEFAEWFTRRGHTVDIIAPPPHYPQWRVADSYRNRWWFTERFRGSRVYRAPLYVPKTPNGSGRILLELSFALTSLPYWLLTLFRRYDAVFAVCPPLQVGIYPYLYSLIRSVPFIFHIQDLQVDIAVRLNMISNSTLVRLLSRVEAFLLTHSTVVSSISEGMKHNILQKGVREKQYFMLPNWVDLDFIRPMSMADSLRKMLGYTDADIIVLYAGNMGEKQGVELVIDAAEHLREQTNIKFLLCGEGVARDRLQQSVAGRQLECVRFLPLQPYEQFPALLATADLHLVVQKKAASDVVMPSKLTSILAAGGASIVTADKNTSLANTIIDDKLGWVIEPENAFALARQIKESVGGGQIKEYRVNARRYAELFLSKDAILQTFERMLIDVSRAT